MKKKIAPEKKSAAAVQLGGQPENDQDARDAGVASATAPQKAGTRSKKKQK